MFVAKPSVMLNAWIANTSKVPLQRYMEDRLTVLMRNVPQRSDPRYRVEIAQDGRALIMGNHDSVEEKKADTDPGIVDRAKLDKLDQSNIEIAGLDRRGRLETENLARLRDEERGAISRAEQSHRLRRDRLLALTCFATLCAGELGAIGIYLADWLGIDSANLSSEISRNPIGLLTLVPVSVGFFALLLLVATTVVEARRKERFFECAVYLIVLLIVGGSLGWLRALQVAEGETSFGVILISMILTVGVPLAAAIAKIWWRNASLKLDETQAPLRDLGMQISRSEANLKEMQRLRRDALRRRQSLENEIQHAGLRSSRQKTREDIVELAALKRIAAKLTDHNQAYTWFSRKRRRELENA